MRLAITILLVALFASALGTSAWAQAGPNAGINNGKKCQTIRTCRFAKGGPFRGCISTYSCRVCRFVPASCRIAGRKGVCRRMRCTWGG